jgi:Holliday junction resolvase
MSKNSYRKGYTAELALTHLLSEHGFMAIRAPRSGRINLPSPDIVAAKDGRLIVIECKSRAAAFTVEKEQMQELREWHLKAGAIPYIGWKISRQGWTFLHLSDVEANNGNIGKKFAKEKGFPLEKIL